MTDAGPSPSGLAWYVDAWAVHDGRIFASRRPPESIAAETTVFLSVPDLRPVPVGRISTALRATRSGFQDRLRDPATLAEIPFDSLAQIRDLTRRAYLGAGLGPGAPGAVAGPVPSPASDSGPGGAYLELRTEELDEEWPVGPEVTPAEPPAVLDAVVREFALASLLAWDGSLEGADPEVVRCFLGWAGALERSEVFAAGGRNVEPWLDLEQLPDMAEHYGAHAVAAACWSISAHIPHGWRRFDELNGGQWSHGVQAIAPLPRIHRWDVRLRRVVELYTLAIIDRRFWRRPMTVLDLAPLVLVSMLQRGPNLGRLPGEPSAAEHALDAVRSELVREPLPEAAEIALEAFIDACLDGPPSHPSSPGAMPTRSDQAEASPPQIELRRTEPEPPRRSLAFE